MSERKKISKHEFYFETPLYETIYADQLSDDNFKGEVDAYSALNGIDTTYEIYPRGLGDYSGHPLSSYSAVTLTCKRRKGDVLCFFVLEGKIDNEDVYVKVGQWLSLVDIQFATIGKKYDKLMDRKDLKEFKRAVGLAAHGVGIGSFVYLRRIFGHLIDETYQKNKKTIGLEAEAFYNLRVAERVTALAAFLPSQLVDMKALYPILSQGIHELDEEECLTYFPVLQVAIELVLDQKIEQDLKVQRDKKVKQQLQDIVAKLKQ